MKKITISLLSLASLILSGCSSSQEASSDPSATNYGTIRISTGINDETEILANIYAVSLEKAGYSVELVDTGDSRQDYLAAMGEESQTQASGSASTASQDEATNDPATVDITPDYSGNLLLYLTDDGAYSPAYLEQVQAEASASAAAETFASASPEAAASTAAAQASASAAASSLAQASASATAAPTSTALKASALGESDILSAIGKLLPQGISLLSSTKAENRDALVLTAATAQKYGISSISDLAQHCSELTFGLPSYFETRSYGLKALATEYGCQPAKVIYQDQQEELSDQLADNTVQVAGLYSASADISDNAYQVLSDPKSIFIPQYLVPLAKTAELPQGVEDIINDISSQLDTQGITTLNRLTTGSDAISKKDAATFWLEQIRE